MNLRAYQSADHTACVNIFNSNVPDYFAAEELCFFTDCLNSSTYLPPRLRNVGIEAGNFYVLEQETKILGCGGWYLDDDIANLCWGMIRREHQRHGLGTWLLQQRIEKIIQHGGVRMIHIRTSSAAQRFYERNGFTVVARNQAGLVNSMPLVELVRAP